MAKAIAPKEFPPLPNGMIGWRRSNRIGSMFHALNPLGTSVCGSIYLDRNGSRPAENIGEMQYWGVCPRCRAKAMKDAG